jgi:hypothetical protein
VPHHHVAEHSELGFAKDLQSAKTYCFLLAIEVGESSHADEYPKTNE